MLPGQSDKNKKTFYKIKKRNSRDAVSYTHLHNYMDFDDLKDYVKISYELTQDGLMISKGILPEFSVAPHGEGICLLYTSRGHPLLHIGGTHRFSKGQCSTDHPLH